MPRATKLTANMRQHLDHLAKSGAYGTLDLAGVTLYVGPDWYAGNKDTTEALRRRGLIVYEGWPSTRFAITAAGRAAVTKTEP